MVISFGFGFLKKMGIHVETHPKTNGWTDTKNPQKVERKMFLFQKHDVVGGSADSS